MSTGQAKKRSPFAYRALQKSLWSCAAGTRQDKTKESNKRIHCVLRLRHTHGIKLYLEGRTYSFWAVTCVGAQTKTFHRSVKLILHLDLKRCMIDVKIVLCHFDQIAEDAHGLPRGA